MNIAISKFSDERFNKNEICEIVTIDNFMVTIRNSKGIDFVVDFEDKSFIFIWGLDDDVCLESLSVCLKKIKPLLPKDRWNDVSARGNFVGVLCPHCKTYNDNEYGDVLYCYNCGQALKWE